MSKWADYLISEAEYDSNYLISKIKQHRDNGESISDGEIIDRSTLANNLGHGSKYMTVYGALNKLRIGKNVRYFRADGYHYIRIDHNKVNHDNLGDLPDISKHEQEEKPALASFTKPKPIDETKPLSVTSSAFFAEPAEVAPEPAEVAPEPAEEAQWGLAVIEDSLWNAVPKICSRFNESVEFHTGKKLPINFSPLVFGSWMGGDRDGNPNVTAKTTEEIVLLSRWEAANLYEKEFTKLN